MEGEAVAGGLLQMWGENWGLDVEERGWEADNNQNSNDRECIISCWPDLAVDRQTDCGSRQGKEEAPVGWTRAGYGGKCLLCLLLLFIGYRLPHFWLRYFRLPHSRLHYFRPSFTSIALSSFPPLFTL